jgi:hypothetical protein
VARNSGVGAVDEPNRRRLKIIYKGTGANNTAGVGGGRQKKHTKRKRNETKKDDGGRRRAAKDSRPKNWTMEQGEGSERIQAARRSDEVWERSTAVGG